MKMKLIFFLAVFGLAHTVNAENQVLDDQEIINLENIYNNKPTIKQTENDAEIEAAPEATITTKKKVIESEPETEVAEESKAEKVENLTDLNKLAPFREISVIQKKYLAKTERFQIFAGLGMTTNSPWFLNLGTKVAFAYHLTESFGVELTGTFLSNTEREVAKEIRENNNLEPEKFVNTKSYLGADLMWVPIYGKISYLNNRIVPFDMYFALGGGTSNTNSQEGNVPTFHVGTGQIFALSKSMAFRWDYSWTIYQATPIAGTTAGAAPSKNSYNDLILTAGLSFFFPEANYR